MTKTAMDVRGVIKLFGGRAQLYRKLCAAKIEISHRTLDNWIYKGMIPMHRFLQLVDLAKADGLKLKLEDHLSEQNTKPDREHRKQPVHHSVPEGTERTAGSGTAGSYLERLRIRDDQP
jgi:hypothetical protein